MRSDRLLNLWPKLEPELRKVAIHLCRNYPNIDHRDLISEGVLAIKRTHTTKKAPHRLNYLIKRAKFSMQRLFFYEVSLTSKAIPIDEIINPADLS